MKNGDFSIVMLVYQRVYNSIRCLIEGRGDYLGESSVNGLKKEFWELPSGKLTKNY